MAPVSPDFSTGRITMPLPGDASAPAAPSDVRRQMPASQSELPFHPSGVPAAHAAHAAHATASATASSATVGMCGASVGRRFPRGISERRPGSASYAMTMTSVSSVVQEPRARGWRKTAWFVGGVVLVLIGARWGTEVGTSRRIHELEERLRLLEAEQLEWRRRAEQMQHDEEERKINEREHICISSVHHSGAGWRFLRADGSEAAFIKVEVSNSTPVDTEAVAARRATETASQCVVNITMAEDTGSLEVRRLSGEVSEVRRIQQESSQAEVEAEADDRPAPSNITASPGQMSIATELMRAPAHALLPTQPAHVPQTVRKSEYPELTCDGTGQEDWIEVKSLTSSQFGSWHAGIELQDAAQLQVLVDAAVQRLSSKSSWGSSAGECGMGRLCMSILAVLAGSTGGVLLGAHAIHSPLITVLLDVPWRLVIHSGWPLFGMLSQLHLRARQRQDAPTTGPAADYFIELGRSLERREARLQGDLPLENDEAARLAYLGADFLRSEEGRAHASTYVIPGLCALASQLLSPEVGTASMPVDKALDQVQGFFRQAVQSIEDLQGTLDSPWPLYSVLHLASLRLRV